VQAIVVGWGVVGDKKALRWAWVYPLRDVMGFLFWVASYASSSVRYRGEMYTLLEEGKIRKHAPK
jgi:ceramide glucosyltransferase